METSVNRKDLVGLGPTRKNPVPDPLAVLHLENWLYIFNSSKLFFKGIVNSSEKGNKKLNAD